MENFLRGLPAPPFALFCVAGGTAEEIGLFADISPDAVRSCMVKNYLSSAYIANVVMKHWLAESPEFHHCMGTRHLIFTASTAALIAVPGYTAYAPTKAAIRALADQVRQESLIYRHRVNIQVHCSFPGTIYTDSFYKEQAGKPAICKQIEGSTDDTGGLPADEVARIILAGLDKGRFSVTCDWQTALLLNNMRGPSPGDVPVFDFALGLLASLVWPVVRRYFDWLTARFGRSTEWASDSGHI